MSVRFFQVSLVDSWFCILPLVPVPRVLAGSPEKVASPSPPPLLNTQGSCPLGLCPEASDSAPCCPPTPGFILAHLCIPTPESHIAFLGSPSSDCLRRSGCFLCTLQTGLVQSKLPSLHTASELLWHLPQRCQPPAEVLTLHPH